MDVAKIKAMLDNPTVADGTPVGFNSNEEAEYLSNLIDGCPALKKYQFDSFIAAGGAGMVFKVRRNGDESFFTSLKIVRKAIFENPEKSPFSDEELDALKELVHANILRQYEFVEQPEKGTVAICAALISNPQGFDRFVQSILNQTPKSKDKYSQISFERLNNACEAIIDWIYQIAQAVQYMHEQGYYHMDIKPANILIHHHGSKDIPIITDMGSCIKESNSSAKRVHFTWAYAHPELTDMQSHPGSIEGGGLRASADAPDPSRLCTYDLYALGRTIQQILAVVEDHFGEMSFSNYTFRYMQIISALLLDGKNSSKGIKKRAGIEEQHKVKFVSDFPMSIRESIFIKKKITTTKELVERLKRYKHEYSIEDLADEFGLRSSQVLNNTIGDLVPFSYRVSRIFNHPTLKRLYGEPQLGLMTEVYPGASHNRWSHSVGVYALVLKYYTFLLSDPENPLLRILINKEDIDHAIIAATLHDVGHTALCHDLEAANFYLFNHTSFVMDLIKEDGFEGGISLERQINDIDAKLWSKINFIRVVAIIEGKSEDPIDFVATDLLNSPIDADKFDYIKRDSYYCGVSYGSGIDCSRFLNSLTVKEVDNKIRLAYYFKGRTAISSMLLARYQLYGSVYWHHTYRCLHSMLYYATQLAFGSTNYPILKIDINKSRSIEKTELRKLYYYRVVCRMSWANAWKKIGYDYTYIKTSLKMNAQCYKMIFL
jgi:HD superfamily phosphohydrolases